jgi:wyosine [tRNA(Phe)-imidazoG37] synthetase (radical SAM superfamily)
MKNYRYLFGPVPSRRFGRSLGVDLTPRKTCSLNCVFCQLGPTPQTTLERREYVPTEDVLAELGDWLNSGGQADYISLAGSGEPTLHSGFGKVLRYIREHSDIPSALLTNSTLLHLPEVRAAAAEADVVKASLSAWNQASFGWINRPDPHLRFDDILAGLQTFRSEYSGQIWLEVFLVGGMNATRADVRKIAALAATIAPDRIQLNTAVRPPAEDFATPLSRRQLEELAPLFEPPAEVIAEFDRSAAPKFEVNLESICAMLQRRPCTAGQIAQVFGLHPNEVAKYLGRLVREARIRSESRDGEVYYRSVESAPEHAGP